MRVVGEVGAGFVAMATEITPQQQLLLDYENLQVEFEPV